MFLILFVAHASGALACSWAGDYRDGNQDLKQLLPYSGGQYIDQLHPDYTFYTRGDTLVSVKNGLEGHMSSDCSSISWSTHTTWYRLRAVESTTTPAAVSTTTLAVVMAQVSGALSCDWAGDYRDGNQDLKELLPYSGGQFIDQLHPDYTFYTRGDTLVSVKNGLEGHMSSDCSSISWSTHTTWYRLRAVESTTTPAAVSTTTLAVMMAQVSGALSCDWAGDYRDGNQDLKELLPYSGGQFIDQLHPDYTYYTRGDTLVSVKNGHEGHMSSDCRSISWSTHTTWYRLRAVESTTMPAVVV